MQTWVEQLIREYSDGKRRLVAYRKQLDLTKPDEREESKIVSGMIADMQFAITWMRTGRRPGNRRGIDVTDAYKRAALMDMDLFPSLDIEPEPEEISESQKKRLVDALITLSARERQCYLLHMAKGLSEREIAQELKLKRPSVQVYLKRAKSKVEQAVSG